MEKKLPNRKNKNRSVWRSIADRIGKHQQRRRAEATAFLLEPRPNDLILDVGCGNGSITKYFTGHAWHVVGLDISSELLRKTKLNLGRMNVSLVAGEATRLPFRPSCFDRVVLLEVLEHLPNPGLCAMEVDRCAKKSCELVVSVPYKERDIDKARALFGHLHSFDAPSVVSLFPPCYTLIAEKHLPNLFLLLPPFEFINRRIWFALNDVFGVFLKGYWIILRLRRVN